MNHALRLPDEEWANCTLQLRKHRGLFPAHPFAQSGLCRLSGRLLEPSRTFVCVVRFA